MNIFLDAIHILFPILGMLSLSLGIKYGQKNYLISALWLSLIGLLLHYHSSGGEILGSYFNYFHALIYSFNLIVISSAIMGLLFASKDGIKKSYIRYLAGFFSAAWVTASTLLILNLFINANFVENRLQGTPILQVTTVNKQEYCRYKYVFYSVGLDNRVHYLCPNYYGFLPSVGSVDKNHSELVIKLFKNIS